MLERLLIWAWGFLTWIVGPHLVVPLIILALIAWAARGLARPDLPPYYHGRNY